jgi:hypothetical protein
MFWHKKATPAHAGLQSLFNQRMYLLNERKVKE